MTRSVSMGTNRTGVDMSPVDSKEMLDGSESYRASRSEGSTVEMMRREWIRNAEPLGTVPVPGTGKGMLTSLTGKMTGKGPEMLINKLGERLAFERTGVRLYEAFILKCEGSMENAELSADISLERLREFHQEEQAHFELVRDALSSMGADPTTQTPDADAAGVASSGQIKVLTDPRTTVVQCLEAVLSIELIDNAEWELLIALAEDMGMDDLREQFMQAARQENRHLEYIRQCYHDAVRTETRTAH